MNSEEERAVYERVSKNVYLLRHYRGYIQSELAQKAGVSPSSIAMVESGDRTGSLGQLEKVAVALGVPLGFLVDADLDKIYRNAIEDEIKRRKPQ